MVLDQPMEAGLGGRRGVGPGEVLADPARGRHPLGSCRGRVACYAPEQLDQGIGVRLQQPGPAHGLDVAHAAFGELARRAGIRYAVASRGIIERRPGAGDDRRQAARHRLDHRQGEPFAAERVHQAVAGRIKTGQLRLAQARSIYSTG